MRYFAFTLIVFFCCAAPRYNTTPWPAAEPWQRHFQTDVLPAAPGRWPSTIDPRFALSQVVLVPVSNAVVQTSVSQASAVVGLSAPKILHLSPTGVEWLWTPFGTNWTFALFSTTNLALPPAQWQVSYPALHWNTNLVPQGYDFYVTNLNPSCFVCAAFKPL